MNPNQEAAQNEKFLEMFEGRIEMWDDSMPYRFLSGAEFISDVNPLMEEVLAWHQSEIEAILDRIEGANGKVTSSDLGDLYQRETKKGQYWLQVKQEIAAIRQELKGGKDGE